jgi:hypothetical protein
VKDSGGVDEGQRRIRWKELRPDDLVAPDLTSDERELLWQGLHQWGGPTRPTDAVARVIGFENVDAMHGEGQRIREAIRAGDPLSRHDWRRALVATEIAVASEYYGAGSDWEIVTAFDDGRSLSLLRGVQRRLAGLRAPPRRSPEYDPEH